MSKSPFSKFNFADGVLKGAKMVSDNIVSVLSRGNQEMFHSAMLAWLMDEGGSHGLGRAFLSGVFSSLGVKTDGVQEVVTEHRGRHGRYDILLRDPSKGDKTIVFENKTKSLGAHSQGARYAVEGATVLLLALLPEMFDEESRNAWPLLSYRGIHDLLVRMELDPSNGHQFVVAQYRDYLDAVLRPFELIQESANGGRPFDSAVLKELQSAISSASYNENDWRTLNYYYFAAFRDYLRSHAPDLVFGTRSWDASEAGENMLWQAEKDRQGPPFMEAVLYAPDRLSTKWTLKSDIAARLRSSEGVTPLIPRLELSGLSGISNQLADPTVQVGRWALGVYGGVPQPLWDLLNSSEDYKGGVNGSRRRNFRFIPVTFQDLAFERMADLLRELLAYLYDRAGNEVETAL